MIGAVSIAAKRVSEAGEAIVVEKTVPGDVADDAREVEGVTAPPAAPAMLEAASSDTDRAGAAADDAAAGGSSKGPTLPPGLERREVGEDVHLSVSPELKVTEAEAVRVALIEIIASDAAEGRTISVDHGEVEAEAQIGVPALQLAIAGARFAEGAATKPGGGGRKSRSGRKAKG